MLLQQVKDAMSLHMNEYISTSQVLSTITIGKLKQVGLSLVISKTYIPSPLNQALLASLSLVLMFTFSMNTTKKLKTLISQVEFVLIPMPPSFMLTLYNNDAAFEQKYLHDSPGYYLADDSGCFDEDGYLNVMARIDDVINTAGHRLSTGSMEEALLKHDNIVEAAVVTKHCDFKGEIPFGFVVPKDSQEWISSCLKKNLLA
ncbi:hypothetical protein ABPG72_001437 [Tetrahymena utriculariae]